MICSDDNVSELTNLQCGLVFSLLPTVSKHNTDIESLSVNISRLDILKEAAAAVFPGKNLRALRRCKYDKTAPQHPTLQC